MFVEMMLFEGVETVEMMGNQKKLDKTVMAVCLLM